jgi:hypothetical protein
MCVFFSLRFFSFLGCFARFVIAFLGVSQLRGVQKRDNKIAENIPQPPKKALTHLPHPPTTPLGFCYGVFELFLLRST